LKTELCNLASKLRWPISVWGPQEAVPWPACRAPWAVVQGVVWRVEVPVAA